MHHRLTSRIGRIACLAVLAVLPACSSSPTPTASGADYEKLYQQRRLNEIPSEIASEPVRIRGTYAVKAEPRVEPIGIVYLWPRTR